MARVRDAVWRAGRRGCLGRCGSLGKVGEGRPEQAPGPLGIPRVPASLDHDRVSGDGDGDGLRVRRRHGVSSSSNAAAVAARARVCVSWVDGGLTASLFASLAYFLVRSASPSFSFTSRSAFTLPRSRLLRTYASYIRQLVQSSSIS